MKRNGWLAMVLAAVCVLAEVAVAQDEVLAAGSPWTSPLGMEFAWVPAGRFEMGSPEGEEGRYVGEDQHEVRISEGFWMGKYEVTQGEWEKVMGSNPSYSESCGARCPVETVSWEDVLEFIQRLNELEFESGHAYRLPSEAEWEYAARAGTTGARHGDLDSIAWHEGNSGFRTHPVGGKRANGWGLHDMLGNMWEWTADWRGDYPSGMVEDPRGPSTGSNRVARGGGWHNDARSVRSAYRGSYSPGYRGRSLGFRLVRTMENVADPQDDGSLRSAAGSSSKSPMGMEFAWVPAGMFKMGSPEGEEGREDDERQHEVRISEGFWMGKYEVTQGEWERVMGSNPSYFESCGARCPVESVSWEDVQEFIQRLNELEFESGHVYRLPTEAEWEWATRAGSAGATPEGDLRILGEHNAPVLDGQAWYGGNSGVSYAGRNAECSEWEEKQYEAERCGTHPVGLKRANGWGLHDMLGNVWEWTADWYGGYPSGMVTDPRGPSTGSHRVARGGSWRNDARRVRSAARGHASPGYRAYSIGFRLVRTE